MIIFIVAFIVGAVYSLVHPQLLEVIIKIFRDKFPRPTIGWTLVWQIFSQNLLVACAAMLGGILFGLIPVFTILFNGFILGFIASITLRLLPWPLVAKLGFFAATLLPHGIFEIPAILLASTLGLRFGIHWMTKDAAQHRAPVIKEDFVNLFKAAPVIFVALFLAAVIEVFVSGKLGEIITGHF